MPNIKKVELTAKTIKGLQARTKNEDEMNPDTQKIALLWGKFFSEVMPTFGATPPPLYGVYSNYESDAFGEFDVLVGAEVLEESDGFKSVTLEAGNYLVFTAKGELPQAIIETWSQVWAYFEDPSIDEKRAFKTDFELYTSETEAEIYIGVHYL